MRWLAAHGSAFFAPDGTPTRFIGTVFDITDRKLYADELRRQAEFEQQLIGIVSHDLRNPIGAILMATQVLEARGTLDEAQAQVVRRIRSSGERASRLVRDLLDFTQARLGGGIPIDPTDTDLARPARQIVEEVQASNPDRDVSLEIQGDCRACLDTDRMAQVLTNLLGNALQYSPPGTPVQLRVAALDGHLRLHVHNQGPPYIGAELAARLFEPLRRGTAGGRTGSVGLGLYIVKSIITAHSGTIEVDSREGAGTTFTVTLPRTHEPRARSVPPANPTSDS